MSGDKGFGCFCADQNVHLNVETHTAASSMLLDVFFAKYDFLKILQPRQLSYSVLIANIRQL